MKYDVNRKDEIYEQKDTIDNKEKQNTSKKIIHKTNDRWILWELKLSVREVFFDVSNQSPMLPSEITPS